MLKYTNLLLFLLTSMFAFAQDHSQKLQNPWVVAGKYKNEYQKYIEMKSLNKNYQNSDFKNSYSQLMGIMSSRFGKYEEAYEFYSKIMKPKKPYNASFLCNYKQVDFYAAIDSLALDHKIIIINEAHHVPKHRVTTINILKVLYDKGFRYIAAEALANSPGLDSSLNTNKYPTTSNWLYKEPLYGDLIRQALKLGYKAISYESRGMNRDSLQAVNIVNKCFKKDKNAKIIVHAGYGHAYEKPIEGKLYMMAYYLKQITGYDPLTIDQQLHMEQLNKTLETSAYKFAIDSLEIKNPTVFKNRTGEFWRANTDMILINPRTKYNEYNRPAWLQYHDKQPYTIPYELVNKYKKPILVKARLFNESESSIPVDQIELTGKKDSHTLFLHKDKEYDIEVINSKGVILETNNMRF